MEGLSSIQLTMIDGYFLVNQRKKAGTPMLRNYTTKIESINKTKSMRWEKIKLYLQAVEKVGEKIRRKTKKTSYRKDNIYEEIFFKWMERNKSVTMNDWMRNKQTF